MSTITFRQVLKPSSCLITRSCSNLISCDACVSRTSAGYSGAMHTRDVDQIARTASL